MPRPIRCLAIIVVLGALPGCLQGSGGAIGADTAATADVVDDTGAADVVVPVDTLAPLDTIEPGDTAVMDATAADTEPAADASAASCSGRCDQYDPQAACQCDGSCTTFHNCCDDYATLCVGPADAADFLVASGAECGSAEDWFRVTHVRDGDTIDLANGEAVRFLVMNTPEISSSDCYALEARDFTRSEVTLSGGEVCLVAEAAAGDRDLYDRLLRYVYVRDPLAGGAPINLNLRLVRLGYAHVYYPYARGRRYELQAVAMQDRARTEARGGWGSCGW